MAIPPNTKPNPEASLLLSALRCVMRHVPVPAPQTAFDRFPPERAPLSQIHVPWSFHVLAPTSQFPEEARKLGSNTTPMDGCREPTDASCFSGVFLLAQTHFCAPPSSTGLQGRCLGTSKGESICFNTLILLILLRSCVRSLRDLHPNPQRSLSE